MKYFTENKKSILFGIGFLFFIAPLKAQEPVYAQQLYQQKSLARAKVSIDSFVQIHTNNAVGWLLKANIYNAISKDASLKDLLADGRMEAFTALQKALQLNNTSILEQLKATNFSLPNDLYDGYTEEGLAYYNAGAESNNKSNFIAALDRFKKAGTISRWMYANGLGQSAMDTLNIYYSAMAAIKAGKEDDAFLWAKKIVDAGFSKSNTGAPFNTIYEWLPYFYKQQKDSANLLKYAHIGSSTFPDDTYFMLLLVDWYREQQDFTQLFAQYDILFKAQPNNKAYRLAYLQDVFNYRYNSKAVQGKDQLESILKTGLTGFLDSNNTSTKARLLLAKLYSNQTIDKQRQSNNTYLVLDLLQRSNRYLKEITGALCSVAPKDCSEAKQLLQSNNRKIAALRHQ